MEQGKAMKVQRTAAVMGCIAGLALGGCSWFGGPTPTAQTPTTNPQVEQDLLSTARLRTRPPVNTTRNLYEGSLWRGAASWGNLMRDHRARYPGDLLTVTEMGKIIKVPDQKPAAGTPGAPGAAGQAAQAAAPANQGNQGKPSNLDPIIAFLKEQEERQAQIEKEQNEILAAIDTVEVEVVRTLPNGNMMVRGTHPPIFRDRNRVKYIVTLRGIVRPSDVDDKNNIPAPKLSKAEYKIRRLVKRIVPPIGALARATNKPKEGALFDRLTDFITSPGQNRSTQVSPQ
ncbi:MAG TPA: flagellar basal body L-ring protein FlgH [bacterium]